MENFTSQQRILVVNDNQDAAEMLQVLLQLEGTKYVSHSAGSQASLKLQIFFLT
jgi:PleD family two-component response regulator